MSRGFLLLFTPVRNLFAIHARRELRELFAFQLLFSFAFSLIVVFEPIFFYQQGIPLATICLYYALHYTLYVVIMPFGAKVAARYGLERSLALAMPLFVIYFVTLAAIPVMPQLFWLAIIVLTVHKIFYWPAYHAYFANFTDRRNRGTEQSWARAITYSAGIAGPAFGGLVATYAGFPVLFLIAAVTVLLAGVPLLLTKEKFRPASLPYYTAWKIIRSKTHRRVVLAMVGWAEDLVLLVLWPIWMFVILGSTESVGLLASVGIAGMTVWGFVIGDLIDRRSARWVLRYLGVPLVFVGNLLRLFAHTPLRVVLTDVWLRVANINFQLPFITQLYSSSRRFGSLRYALAFETVLAIAKAAIAWVLVIVFITQGSSAGFTVAFTLAAVLSLLYAVL